MHEEALYLMDLDWDSNDEETDARLDESYDTCILDVNMDVEYNENANQISANTSF